MNENFETMLNNYLNSYPVETKAKHRAKSRKANLKAKKKLMGLAKKDYMTVGSSRYAIQTKRVPNVDCPDLFPFVFDMEELPYVRKPHSSTKTSFIKKRSHKKARRVLFDEFAGKGNKINRIVDFVWEML